MQEHKNDYTCTGEHYSLFVVRHVGTARLDSLDTLASTRSTKSNVSSRVETSQVEFGPKTMLGSSGRTKGLSGKRTYVTK